MRGAEMKLLGKHIKNDGGFTLVELMVVKEAWSIFFSLTGRGTPQRYQMGSNF